MHSFALPPADLFPPADLLPTLLATSPASVILYLPVHDAAGEVVDFALAYLNPTAQRLLRLPAAPAARYTQLFPESQVPGGLARHQEAFASGQPADLELLYQAGNWRQRWQVAVQRVGAGLLASFLTMPRLMPELVGRESDAELQLLADTLPQIVWLTDAEGRTQFFNRQWTAYTGVPYEPTTAAAVAASFVHPDDAGPTMTAFTASRHTGHLFEVEHRIRSAAGDYRWFLVRAEPYYDPHTGTLTHWLGTSVDIHDRKQAEEALRRSEERLRKALSIETVGIVFLDSAGNVHAANEAFERLSGYTNQDFVSGRVHWHDLTPPEFEAETAAARQQLLTLGQSTPYEKQGIRADGSRWWGLYAGKRLSEDEFVNFVLDITGSKQAAEQLQDFNERLQRANVDLDNFIYTASHDLRAPITNIEGLIYALQSELPLAEQSPDVAQLLTLMQESVTRFQRTIEHLGEITKQQKEPNQPATAIALRPVIEDVRSDLAPLIQQTGAVVEVAVADGPHVLFSAKNLRSVVYNLLSNALKYRHPDRAPHVRVGCHQQPGYSVLTVQDNGLGLTTHQQGELFLLFRRLHQHIEGSGIGLYMVKKIVENVGGWIAVQSEPEAGTTFSVYFPR